MYIRDYIKTLSNDDISSTTKTVIELMPEYIINNSRCLEYKKPSNLLTKGDNVTFVYYVVSGSFNVVNEFESGKIYEPVVLNDSDFIGVVEAVRNMKTIISTISVRDNAMVFQFDKELFLRWINESHGITKILLDSVSSNFTQNMVESGEAIILDLRYALINHLLKHAVKFNDVYLMDESREKTSIRTGINIRTLYRHIKELRNSNLISTKGRKIFFNDSQKDLLYTLHQDLRNK